MSKNIGQDYDGDTEFDEPEYALFHDRVESSRSSTGYGEIGKAFIVA